MLIFSELLEIALNNFIYANKKRSKLIQFLQEKTFKIEILELSYPIILIFNLNRIYVFNKCNNQLDCIIQTNLKSFFLFLINKEEKKNTYENISFKIHGNLKTAQDFIKCINIIKFNFLEFFFPYINNYLFFFIYNITQSSVKNFKKNINNFMLCCSAAITDEWKLLPHFLELLWFYKEIHILEIKLYNLSKRLKKLEKYNDI